MEMELKCKHCSRHLGKAYGTVIAEIICPNSSCKAGNQIKIINADIATDYRYKFRAPERPPKKKEAIVS